LIEDLKTLVSALYAVELQVNETVIHLVLRGEYLDGWRTVISPAIEDVLIFREILDHIGTGNIIADGFGISPVLPYLVEVPAEMASSIAVHAQRHVQFSPVFVQNITQIVYYRWRTNLDPVRFVDCS
jgi:hypothetical protein